jgi:SAM-dependent methyltransferase
MPVSGNEPPEPEGHWFEPIADYLGPAYLRYSFTKGTAQETGALIDLLGLGPGARVLDVGCGPGRHALALAAAGIDVVGLDISVRFVAEARSRATELGLGDRARFVVGDARRLAPGGDGDDVRAETGLGLGGVFDAVISLCQGAFGLAGGPGAEVDPVRELDEPIMAGMAAALRPGASLAVSAFSAYFQVRYLEDHDTFDADTGVNHETTTIRNDDGAERSAQLWTTCFTPRELRLLARHVGLVPLAVHGVTPGAYRPGPPTIECPEFLLLARRPDGDDHGGEQG